MVVAPDGHVLGRADYSESMNAFAVSTVLLLIIVGMILAVAKEIGKGAEGLKSGITLVVLCAISGFVAALASGSI